MTSRREAGRAPVILIAAVANNMVIGKGNALPWGRLKADMAEFRRVTYGSVVIMGRKTWESLPEKHRPLEGRTNIILCRDYEFKGKVPVGVEVAICMDHALAIASTLAPDKTIYVVGGAQVYHQAQHFADHLCITRIYADYEGDTFFEVDMDNWEIESALLKNEEGVRFSFINYRRTLGR